MLSFALNDVLDNSIGSYSISRCCYPFATIDKYFSSNNTESELNESGYNVVVSINVYKADSFELSVDC